MRAEARGAKGAGRDELERIQRFLQLGSAEDKERLGWFRTARAPSYM